MKSAVPWLISNLCRKDMKHFVVEKPQGCKWRFTSADLPRHANNAGRLSEKLWLILTVRDGLLSIPAC